MISHIRQAHPQTQVILVSPPAVIPPARKTESAHANTQMMAQMAGKLEIPFVDVFSAMQNAAYDLEPNNLYKGLEKFSEDGLHLTSDGYAVSPKSLCSRPQGKRNLQFAYSSSTRL